jgi:putative addiction module component (TIGR02574 family)
MTKAARELLKQALKLPDEERVRLARTLLETVDLGDDDDHDLSPEWRAELERRISDDEPTSWFPGGEFFAKLREAQRHDEGKPRR